MPRQSSPFSVLSPWLRHWIALEQVANDRRSHPRLQHRFALRQSDLPAQFWPENRQVFSLPYVLLPESEVLAAGAVTTFLVEHFKLDVPAGSHPMFIHPANRQALRSLARAGLGIRPSPLRATPTSSFRSLLCWHEAAPWHVAVIKLSLPIAISGVVRRLSALEVFGSVRCAGMLRAIPTANKATLRIEVFDDVAGSSSERHSLGQIFRRLPAACSTNGQLVPAFSLATANRSRTVLQRVAGAVANCARLIDEMLQYQVAASSFLLFHQGIIHEFHPQNVLFEINRHRVTQVIFRDFYRAAVSPQLRALRGLTMVDGSDDPPGAPPASRYLLQRLSAQAPTAYLRVFGVRGMAWELGRALRAADADGRHRSLVGKYLQLWREATAVWSGVWPKWQRNGPGLALNDAVRMQLRAAHMSPCAER